MSEFKGITGPGKYRRRNETVATINERNPDRTIPAIYRWKDEHGRTYRDEGNFYVGSLDLRDIIAGPLTDDPELAGLTGYVAVSTDGDATHGDLEIQPAMRAAIYGGGIIDLRTIRKEQLVKPEPKREKRKVWLSFENNGSIYAYSARPPGAASEGSVALVEREIEFTHGEGLGDGS